RDWSSDVCASDLVRAQRDAMIDDLLAAAFHLGVGTLDGRKIQVARLRTAGHAGSRAAAQTDQHGRTTQHHQSRTRRQRTLFHVMLAYIAHAARDHDGLVVTTQTIRSLHFKTSEVTAQVGSAELVVEARRADRAVAHDLQRAGHPLWATVIPLPRLLEIRDAQIGDGKATQTGL